MTRYDPYAVADTFPSDRWEGPVVCGPNGGECVEVNLARPGVVAIRDKKLSCGPVFVFDDEEWRAFLGAVRAGQYDR